MTQRYLSLILLILHYLYQFLSQQNHAYYSVKSQRDKTKKLVAITFDDGPHGTLTPRLLNILKETGGSVTFFVMGVKVARHGDILKRAINEGHEIANHVWNHPVLSKISYDAVFQQLNRTSALIHQVTGGYTPKIMRPPYGNTNPKLNKYITESSNLSVVMWSYDTNDWKHPKVSELVSKSLQKIQSGDIVLCHDIHPGTIQAMKDIIIGLQKNGFSLVTVSNLIANQI